MSLASKSAISQAMVLPAPNARSPPPRLEATTADAVSRPDTATFFEAATGFFEAATGFFEAALFFATVAFFPTVTGFFAAVFFVLIQRSSGQQPYPFAPHSRFDNHQPKSYSHAP